MGRVPWGIRPVTLQLPSPPSQCPLTAPATLSAQGDAGPGGRSRLLSDDRCVGAAWTKASGPSLPGGPPGWRAERPRVEERWAVAGRPALSSHDCKLLGIICLLDSFRAGLSGQKQAQALPTGPPARGD